MRGALELVGLAFLSSLLLGALGFAERGVYFAGLAMALYATIVVVCLQRSDLLAKPLGWPNRVTAARGLLGGILLGSLLSPGHAAAVSAIAVAAIASDALDGWLARRQGVASEFGARFDMETDAALMLVLCLVLVGQGRGAVWLLTIGLARYAFVAAGFVWTSLRRPLFASARRRFVAAGVMIALAAATLPALPAHAALAITAAATIATLLSFAIDIAWLLRRGARA